MCFELLGYVYNLRAKLILRQYRGVLAFYKVITISIHSNFHIHSFDIMLDHKLKPWLIEVNHTPSFATDTPLDRSIKKGAIRDALKLMNISAEQKIKFKNKKRAEMQ